MKKYILLLVLLVSVNFAYSEKIRVWHKLGVPVRYTFCPVSVDFNRCISDALEANPDLLTYTPADVDRADFPSGEGNLNRTTWEYDSNSKKVKVNQQKKQAIIDKVNKKRNARKETAKALKNLGLTKEQIKDALGLDEDELTE